MNKLDDDKLKALFQNIEKQSPSMSFEYKLMQKVRAKHLIQERKRSRIATLWMVLGGVGLVLLTAIVLSVFGVSVLDVFDKDFSRSFTSMNIDPMIVSIAIACFFLLAVDTLVRKHLREKDENKE